MVQDPLAQLLVHLFVGILAVFLLLGPALSGLDLAGSSWSADGNCKLIFMLTIANISLLPKLFGLLGGKRRD